MNADDKDMDITLPLLQSIEECHDLTQRNLAERLNLALGLTNSYLKHCIRKGLVKIEQTPANRYLYYLTPKGFAEKSRLTAKYLSSSFKFYRSASDACLDVFNFCRSQDWHRVVVCGVSDLAEIAVLRSTQAGITVLGVYDKKQKSPDFLGYPVWNKIEDFPRKAVCIVTALDRPHQLQKELQKITGKERILLPEILKIVSVR